MNPLNPNLTPEQRLEAVRKQTALWHRAAAFGRLTHQNQKLQSELAALKAKLKEFESVEPGKGEGDRAPSAGEGRSSAWAAIRADLERRAHPR